MHVIIDDFCQNVMIRLERKGWTRSEFARQLGVTPGYVTQILNGHHEPGLRVVERWAEVLGVCPSTLIKAAKSEKVA